MAIQNHASFSGLLLDAVSFCYGRQRLFSDLSLSVKTGQLLQLVGANGAGKSTLLRIMAGLLAPETGVLSWCGSVVNAKDAGFQHELFYLGHSIGIKPSLTALENLLYDYRLSAVDRQTASDALSRVNLQQYADKSAAVLSRGQKQRLALARLLCCQPRLLLLDEPLTALDLDSVTVVQNVLAEKVAMGAVVVVSSHQKLSFDQFECLYHVL